MQFDLPVKLMQLEVIGVPISVRLTGFSGSVCAWARDIVRDTLDYVSLLGVLLHRQFELGHAARTIRRLHVVAFSVELVFICVGPWARIVHLDGDMRLSWEAAQYREGLVAVLLDSQPILIVVAGAGQCAIVRYTLFVVNSIIRFSTSAEGVQFTLVVAGVRLFEIAWQLVRSGLRRLHMALSDSLGCP